MTRNELADRLEHKMAMDGIRGLTLVGYDLLREAAQALRDVVVHPHCELSVSRSLAPDHLWHWTVTMPDGHIYAAGAGFASLASALTDMQETGRRALTEADEKWRAALSPKAAPSGDEATR